MNTRSRALEVFSTWHIAHGTPLLYTCIMFSWQPLGARRYAIANNLFRSRQQWAALVGENMKAQTDVDIDVESVRVQAEHLFASFSNLY